MAINAPVKMNSKARTIGLIGRTWNLFPTRKAKTVTGLIADLAKDTPITLKIKAKQIELGGIEIFNSRYYAQQLYKAGATEITVPKGVDTITVKQAFDILCTQKVPQAIKELERLGFTVVLSSGESDNEEKGHIITSVLVSLANLTKEPQTVFSGGSPTTVHGYFGAAEKQATLILDNNRAIWPELKPWLKELDPQLANIAQSIMAGKPLGFYNPKLLNDGIARIQPATLADHIVALKDPRDAVGILAGKPQEELFSILDYVQHPRPSHYNEIITALIQANLITSPPAGTSAKRIVAFLNKLVAHSSTAPDQLSRQVQDLLFRILTEHQDKSAEIATLLAAQNNFLYQAVKTIKPELLGKQT